MNNNRPSFGEFSGYFNICKADFERFAVGDWEKQVICDQQFIPKLTKKENNAAKGALAEVLLEVGYYPSDLAAKVSFLWPEFFFSIERDQSDRSIRVYLSSAVKLTVIVLERLRKLMLSQFPAWRVVIVLPRGDEPDIVIYKDSIRIGDQVESSVTVFEFMKAKWVVAEKHGLTNRSSQIHSLNHSVPTLYLNPQRNIFLLESFAWSIDPESSPMEFTVWFATVGKKRGDPPRPMIETLEIGSNEYPASYPVLGGLFDSEGKWNFVSFERSFGYCCYFLVPPFNSETEFALKGYELKPKGGSKQWRFAAKFGVNPTKPFD